MGADSAANDTTSGPRRLPAGEAPIILLSIATDAVIYDFVQARDILQHLYPDLQPSSTNLTGKLIAFNQRSFIQNAYSSMNNTGYAYIPKACDSESCRVHVVFHGCLQTTQAIGDRFYTSTGYNRVADANKIIVLYPQAEPSPVYPYNPKGCWDF